MKIFYKLLTIFSIIGLFTTTSIGLYNIWGISNSPLVGAVNYSPSSSTAVTDTNDTETVNDTETDTTIDTTTNTIVSGTLENPYPIYVWTTGGQEELDLCKGAVNIQYSPTPLISEHDGCGGTQVPKTTGSIIQLTGVYEGLYKITGLVASLNFYEDDMNDIPRGYELLFQTCISGSTNMGFWALEKIS